MSTPANHLSAEAMLDRIEGALDHLADLLDPDRPLPRWARSARRAWVLLALSAVRVFRASGKRSI